MRCTYKHTFIHIPYDHHTPTITTNIHIYPMIITSHHTYTLTKRCVRERTKQIYTTIKRDTLLTNEKRRYNYLFWVDLYGANKVRRRKLVGGGESECVGRSMHMVSLGWLPKYLASPRLVMAHQGQYAPLTIVVANGACRKGAPLLTLCEGGPQPERGDQNSNGALSRHAPLAICTQ